MEQVTLQTLEAAAKAAPTPIQGMLIERAVLASAFRLVENKTDAKGAIQGRTRIEFCDFSAEVLARAVEYFTGTPATVVTQDGFFVVNADGYRAGPAGDH